MKTRYLKLGRIWIVAMLLGYMLPAQAKKTLNFTTISGVVKDQETHKTLEYVNISIPGTSIGTVTNADGGFMIKVADSIQAERLEISYLGYRNQILPITGEDVDDVTVYLLPNTNKLPEILIRAIDPLNLIKEAMKKVPENNSLSEDMLTGFYRETVKKRRNYINVIEAIVNVYKTPYSEDSEKEKVQVFKGRQLVSPKVGDTLIVKLQGGPTMPIYADVVKNRDLILGEDALHNYKFSMDSPVMLDKRPHLVVRFSPKT